MTKIVSILDAVTITNNRVKPFSGKKRYLSTGDLSSEGVDDYVFVDYNTKPSRADLLVGDGQLVVARMHGTNKVFLIGVNTEDIIVSTGFLTLKPNKGFNQKYLYHFLRSEYFQRQKDKHCSGATQKSINNAAFERIQIPKYDISEQVKMAQTLDAVDNIYRKRKQAIQLLDKTLLSTFFNMFGDPVINTKELTTLSFGDVCENIKYGTNEKGYSIQKPGSIAALRIPNIDAGRVNTIDLKYVQIDEDEKNKLLLRKGDLLFVRTNGNPEYIGRCAVFCEENKYVYASYLIRARIKKSSPLMPEFIKEALSFPSYRKKMVNETRTTAGNYNINTERLRQLSIIQPPIAQQNHFESISKSIEATKQRMLQQLNEISNQYSGFVQEIFQ